MAHASIPSPLYPSPGPSPRHIASIRGPGRPDAGSQLLDVLLSVPEAVLPAQTRMQAATFRDWAAGHAGLNTDARVHAEPREMGALAALLPNARVVFFVRDPADGLWVRLISQL